MSGQNLGRQAAWPPAAPDDAYAQNPNPLSDAETPATPLLCTEGRRHKRSDYAIRPFSRSTGRGSTIFLLNSAFFSSIPKASTINWVM